MLLNSHQRNEKKENKNNFSVLYKQVRGLTAIQRLCSYLNSYLMCF